MQGITLEEVEFLTQVLVEKTRNWEEPVPNFYTRSPDTLESCLENVFQRYGGEDLYPGIVLKAAYYSTLL